MTNKKITYGLLICSFLLAVTFGMADHESQSIWHLFTAEPGNIVALLLYTAVFTAIGWGMVGLYRLLNRAF